MKIRSLLFACILSVLFLSGGMSTATPTTTRSCPYYNFCVENYNYCYADCNGDSLCVKACQREYSQCQCVNCGNCPPGGGVYPQAESKVTAEVEQGAGTVGSQKEQGR